MPITDNTEIVRRLHGEALNRGKFDLVDEHVAETYVEHDPSAPIQIAGREGYRENIRLIRKGFPDIKLTFDEILADGDAVAVRFTVEGTHDGEFMGYAPTGKPMKIHGIEIDHLTDGQLAEAWTHWDALGMLSQLGLEPKPAPETA